MLFKKKGSMFKFVLLHKPEEWSKRVNKFKKGCFLRRKDPLWNSLLKPQTNLWIRVAKFKHGCFLKRKDPCSNLPYYINPKMADKGKQISKWMLSEKEGSTLKFAVEIPTNLWIRVAKILTWILLKRKAPCLYLLCKHTENFLGWGKAN